MNVPTYSLVQKTLPLTGLPVGGFNGGWPYQEINKIENGTFGDSEIWIDRERGFLPPDVNAIGSAAFGYRPRSPIGTWQNGGAGWGMPVLNADPLAEHAKTIPKELRYTQKDFNTLRSPEGIIKGVELHQNMNWSRGGMTVRGTKGRDGGYSYGAPAGWIESKPHGVLSRGSSIPIV